MKEWNDIDSATIFLQASENFFVSTSQASHPLDPTIGSNTGIFWKNPTQVNLNQRQRWSRPLKIISQDLPDHFPALQSTPRNIWVSEFCYQMRAECMLREAVKSISDANQNGHISCLKNVAVKQIFDDERFNLRQYLLFCLSTLLSLSHTSYRTSQRFLIPWERSAGDQWPYCFLCVAQRDPWSALLPHSVGSRWQAVFKGQYFRIWRYINEVRSWV